MNLSAGQQIATVRHYMAQEGCTCIVQKWQRKGRKTTWATPSPAQPPLSTLLPQRVHKLNTDPCLFWLPQKDISVSGFLLMIIIIMNLLSFCPYVFGNRLLPSPDRATRNPPADVSLQFPPQISLLGRLTGCSVILAGIKGTVNVPGTNCSAWPARESWIDACMSWTKVSKRGIWLGGWE